jgi:hypothetical protein
LEIRIVFPIVFFPSFPFFICICVFNLLFYFLRLISFLPLVTQEIWFTATEKRNIKTLHEYLYNDQLNAFPTVQRTALWSFVRNRWRGFILFQEFLRARVWCISLPDWCLSADFLHLQYLLVAGVTRGIQTGFLPYCSELNHFDIYCTKGWIAIFSAVRSERCRTPLLRWVLTFVLIFCSVLQPDHLRIRTAWVAQSA